MGTAGLENLSLGKEDIALRSLKMKERKEERKKEKERMTERKYTG